LGWGGKSAVEAASAQIHAGCSIGTDAAFAAAAVRLHPLWGLMQHAQHDLSQQQQQQQVVAGSIRRQQGSQQQQQVLQQSGLAAKLTVDHQQALSSFLATLQKLPDACQSAASQLAALQSLSLLLQASQGLLQPVAVAAWLHDAALAVLGIHNSRTSSSRQLLSRAFHKQQQQQQRLSEEAVAELLMQLGTFVRPELTSLAPAAAEATAASLLLPPLTELMPVLHPVLAAVESSESSESAAAQVQAAALQLLQSHLEAAARQQGSVTGSKQLLLDALALVTSPSAAVRSAALQLVQLFMQPEVLQEAFGEQPEQQQQQQQRRRQRGEAAVTVPAADADADAGQSLPRKLLEHLRGMLGSSATSAVQHIGQQQHSIAAQQSVLRAIAGLYKGLADRGGCAELPLLYLLEQCALSEYGQVCEFVLLVLLFVCMCACESRPCFV
jgi:hypothetical protein